MTDFYLVKESELNELVYCKDVKTRVKLMNIIRSHGDSSNTAYYSKSWKELKEWLRSLQKASDQILLRQPTQIDHKVRSHLCDYIASKMDAIDKNNLPANKKNTITMWFSGEDCKKCGNHIYTDGMMDWCKEGCPKFGSPSSWRE